MTERYKLSFTTGGLFLRESEDAAGRFLQGGTWAQTRAAVRSENVLQVRTATASLRISKEVISRLEMLQRKEVEFLIDCSYSDRACLLWTAVCRRYEFVKEFAQEVLRENYVLMRGQVTLLNFDAFLNSKAMWHDELDQLAKSTQSKLRQNLFRMMREAGFINHHYIILQAMPSPALVQLLAQQGADELTIFPVSDLDIKRWLQ
jgi:hypothetical protein